MHDLGGNQQVTLRSLELIKNNQHGRLIIPFYFCMCLKFSITKVKERKQKLKTLVSHRKNAKRPMFS